MADSTLWMDCAEAAPSLGDDAGPSQNETAGGGGGGNFLAALNSGDGQRLLRAYLSDRENAGARNAIVLHYQLCAQIVARQVYRSLTRDARKTIELADAEQTALCLLHN